MSNKELASELHKPIIEKFLKRKVQSPFMDNIWGADLADMQSIRISMFNKGIHFLLSVIDIFSKYAWVIPLKGERSIKILDEPNSKPNKIWVDKGSEFYNRSMKSRLEKMT